MCASGTHCVKRMPVERVNGVLRTVIFICLFFTCGRLVVAVRVPEHLYVNLTTWTIFYSPRDELNVAAKEVNSGYSLIVGNGLTVTSLNISEAIEDRSIYGLNGSIFITTFQRFHAQDRETHLNYSVLQHARFNRRFKSGMITVKTERVCMYNYGLRKRDTEYRVFQGEGFDLYERVFVDRVATINNLAHRSIDHDDFLSWYGIHFDLTETFWRLHNDTQRFCETYIFKETRAPMVSTDYDLTDPTRALLTCRVKGYRPDNIDVNWYACDGDCGSARTKLTGATFSRGFRETNVSVRVPSERSASYSCGIRHSLLNDIVYVPSIVGPIHFPGRLHRDVLLTVMCYGVSVSLLLLFVVLFIRRRCGNILILSGAVRQRMSIDACMGAVRYGTNRVLTDIKSVMFTRTREIAIDYADSVTVWVKDNVCLV